MAQTGHYLDKVHAQRKGAPRYFTACGRRGFTTDKAEAITCKRCASMLKTESKPIQNQGGA